MMSETRHEHCLARCQPQLLSRDEHPFSRRAARVKDADGLPSGKPARIRPIRAGSAGETDPRRGRGSVR